MSSSSWTPTDILIHDLQLQKHPEGGRAEYTLIYPTNPPTIEKHIIGTNVSAGESRQLLVGTGVWKMSRLLPEDMDHGCLITEVVVPGFHWEDHQFLTKGGLHELLENVKGEEKETIMKQLEKHVKGRGA